MSFPRDTTWQSLPSSVRSFSHLVQCLQAGICPDEVVQRVLPSFPLHSLVHYVNALTESLQISVPTRQHPLKATFRKGHRTLAGPVDRKQIGTRPTRPYDRRRGVEAILRENPFYAQGQMQGRVPLLVASGIGAPPGCPCARSHFGIRKARPTTSRAQAIPSVLHTSSVITVARTQDQNQERQCGRAHFCPPICYSLPSGPRAPNAATTKERNRALVPPTCLFWPSICAPRGFRHIGIDFNRKPEVHVLDDPVHRRNLQRRVISQLLDYVLHQVLGC